MSIYLQEINEKWVIEALNAKEPRRTDYAGRTWDYVFFDINGNKIKGYADYSWGHYVYFELNNKWYKLPVSDIIGFDVELKKISKGEYDKLHKKGEI